MDFAFICPTWQYEICDTVEYSRRAVNSIVLFGRFFDCSLNTASDVGLIIEVVNWKYIDEAQNIYFGKQSVPIDVDEKFDEERPWMFRYLPFN